MRFSRSPPPGLWSRLVSSAWRSAAMAYLGECRKRRVCVFRSRTFRKLFRSLPCITMNAMHLKTEKYAFGGRQGPHRRCFHSLASIIPRLLYFPIRVRTVRCVGTVEQKLLIRKLTPRLEYSYLQITLLLATTGADKRALKRYRRHGPSPSTSNFSPRPRYNSVHGLPPVPAWLL